MPPIPVDSKRLSGSSARFAQSALQGLPSGDTDTFALHAGIALEHLAKALLVTQHPVLVAADDFDSLLHASGHSTMAHRATMRTITVTEAVRRAGRFVPQLQNLQNELKVLCDARNGVAHLAHAGQVSDLLVPFLKGCELLRNVLGLDRDVYWGEFVSLVDEALQASVDEARLRVANALGSARLEFEKRYTHLDADARDGVIHAIEAGYDPEKYEEQIIECPACKSPALASGAVETHWEQDDEDSVSFIATFFPGHLRCRVCDLELDGDNELRVAGVENTWDIDVDPADFYEEPDWDDYR